MEKGMSLNQKLGRGPDNLRSGAKLFIQGLIMVCLVQGILEF